MDDSDRRLLVEKVLGECWHEFGNFHYMRKDNHIVEVGGCVSCLCPAGKLPLGYKFFKNKYGEGRHGYQSNNRTFTTRDDMIDLYEAIQKMGEWTIFYRFIQRKFSVLHDFRLAKNDTVTAWLFCLDGTGYEVRCQMVADWAKGEGE